MCVHYGQRVCSWVDLTVQEVLLNAMFVYIDGCDSFSPMKYVCVCIVVNFGRSSIQHNAFGLQSCSFVRIDQVCSVAGYC